jgi:hypothetical protein
MKVDQKIIDRFDELIERGNEVNASFKVTKEHGGRTYSTDKVLCGEWGSSGLSLLGTVFGVDSHFYKDFNVAFKKFAQTYEPNPHVLFAKGVLRSAKDVYENGHANKLRKLIEAEIFDDLLEQAQHLLDEGYFIPAGVLTGCVLEDSLRKLCVKHNVTIGPKLKLDAMNTDLVKVGAYTVLTQKKITWLAGMRNDAAHGKWVSLTGRDAQNMKGEVGKMITDVRSFLENHL